MHRDERKRGGERPAREMVWWWSAQGLSESPGRHAAWGTKDKPVNVKELFDACDKDGDGKLTLSEAIVALRGRVPPAAHEQVFVKYDADHDGTLDIREFTALCRALDSSTLCQKEWGAAGFTKGGSVIDRAWKERNDNFLLTLFRCEALPCVQTRTRTSSVRERVAEIDAK